MRLAIQICAELEWKCTKSILKIKKTRLRFQPFGEYFEDAIGEHEAVFYESGATKTRSAAACQFAIDKWHPDAILNLGTCGGVARSVSKGDIIIAKRTLQYDVFQKFGKPSLRFKRGLATNLETSWIDLNKCQRKIHIGPVASADRDLDDGNRTILQKKGVLAADWESASIAAICRLNKVKCLILRGISDIPGTRNQSSKVLQELDYRKNTRIIMKALFSLIAKMAFGKRR